MGIFHIPEVSDLEVEDKEVDITEEGVIVVVEEIKGEEVTAGPEAEEFSEGIISEAAIIITIIIIIVLIF